MEPGDSIGKLGFKRWYERRLIEGHAWLITCFLCIIVIAAAFEVANFKESLAGAMVAAACVLAAGMLCWYALQRYRELMEQAGRLASRASCGKCGAYAAFAVLPERPKISVRCHKCSHEWQIG